jgi:glycerol-3-phosphate dehydrogenase
MKWLQEKNPHLTNWLPIAVPITRWVIWPPPFGFAPAALGPLGLFPVFFKFYDSLSGFSSPPSHIMMHNRGVRKFPQMDNARIKYCSIFYEGQHDDARTNLAIAQTAAMDGANIVNYCSVVQFSKDANGKIIGAVMRDEVSKELFEVSCKSVLFCGGPFTDELRQMEDSNHEVKRAVKGASGIHIVLPAW